MIPVCDLNLATFTEIVLLILTVSTGTGRCASTSNSSLKLGYGTIVSSANYSTNTNSAASVAVSMGIGTNTCNGVMVSNTTFLISTFCPFSLGFNPTNVYLGSIYFPPNPSFNGQVVPIVSTATTYPNGAVTYETSGIPLVSEAVAAKLNPANSTLPSNTSECVTFGYWTGLNPATDQLNTLPANITDFETCNSTYSQVATANSSLFCARILTPAGSAAACAAEDRLVAVFCKQWLPSQSTRRFTPNQFLRDEVVRRCYFSFDDPICRWICGVQWLHYPFCPNKPQPPTGNPQPEPEPEPEPEWILAGINVANPNACTGPDIPYLFAHVTSQGA